MWVMSAASSHGSCRLRTRGQRDGTRAGDRVSPPCPDTAEALTKSCLLCQRRSELSKGGECEDRTNQPVKEKEVKRSVRSEGH